MTHVQQVFVNNLRFYRTNAGYTQVEFAVTIEVSPNYLNAVENGKYFPSPDVMQRICTTLKLLPYQLFLEQPELTKIQDKNEFQQAVISLKQEIDILFQHYLKPEIM